MIPPRMTPLNPRGPWHKVEVLNDFDNSEFTIAESTRPDEDDSFMLAIAYKKGTTIGGQPRSGGLCQLITLAEAKEIHAKLGAYIQTQETK